MLAMARARLRKEVEFEVNKELLDKQVNENQIYLKNLKNLFELVQP